MLSLQVDIMTTRNKTTAFVVIVLIATSLLSATPILFSHKAEAAAFKRASGQGIGTVTCPNNLQAPGETLTFDAVQSNGQTNGNWNIFIPPVFVNAKQGVITGGSISNNHVTFTGIEQQDTLCGAPVPVTITISASCGQAVPIQFTAANGERGTFTGNVACS